MRVIVAVPPTQRGFLLLEGLIAILIFSAGIIALMGLQAAAIRSSGDAKYRADASFLASQILGDMWADRSNLATYAYNDTAATLCGSASPSTTNARVTNWLNTVSAALPGGKSSIQQIKVGAGNVVTVTVCWQGPQDAGPHNYQVVAQING